MTASYRDPALDWTPTAGQVVPVAWMTDLTGNDEYFDMVNTSACRATGTVSAASGSNATLSLTSVFAGGNCTVGSTSVTVAAAGVYQFGGTVGMTSPSAGSPYRFYIVLLHNGSVYTNPAATTIVPASYTSTIGEAESDIVQCAAADTLGLAVFQQSGSTETVTGVLWVRQIS